MAVAADSHLRGHRMPKTKRRRPNVFRIDPTRTVTIRKRFVAEMRRRFAKIRGEIVRLIAIDDAFGILRRITTNIYCPTGEGGGVDPTCSPADSGVAAISSHVYDSHQTTPAERDTLKKLALSSKTKRPRLERVFSTDPKWQNGEVVELGPTSFSAIRLSKGETAGHIGWKDSDEATAHIEKPTRGVDVDYSKLSAKAGMVSPAEEQETIVAGRYRVRVVKIPMPGTEKDSGWGNTKHYILEELYDTQNKAGDDWRFATSSEQVKAFQEWLEELYGEHLSIQQLIKKFAEDGYKRGIGRAFNDVEKPYGNGKMVYDNLTGDFYTPNRDQFLRSAFGSHIGIERVNQLASRSFGDLKNVTTDMSTRMSRTLLEGLVDGSHPNDIAKDLSKDIDISLSRAETIARTEIIRAHAEGQLDAMERMGVAEVGVQVEWVTAGDDAVCPRCEAMEGVVMEIEKAHNMLPLHPNCRCAFLPAGEVLQPRTIAEAAVEGLALADVENVFCPTGEGGGVDPSCGGDATEGGGGESRGSDSDAEASANGMGRSGAKIKVHELAREILAKMNFDTESAAMVAGAMPSSEVRIAGNRRTGGVEVVIDNEKYSCARVLYPNKTIVNRNFRTISTGEGLGTKVFSQQVAEAAKAGFTEITTTAARDEHSNGYYTWARLGYDGDVEGPDGPTKVSALMKTKEGRDWWKANGHSFDAAFDLAEGSQSRRVLDAYVQEKQRKQVSNIFCPTGEGGGVDPSCGGEGGGGLLGGISSALRSVGEAVGLVRSRTAPPEISVTPKATEHIKTMFGGTGSVDSIAKMVGATDGASVVISEPITHSTGQKFIRAEIDHPDYGAVRWVFDDHIENVTFTAKETGKGLGTKVFAQQVAEAAAKGLKYIGTNAIRTKHANGYYTWARLGYDGKVPMGQHGGKKVSELMKTKEGRDWWKEHGQSTAMTFDLTEGSQSRRVLDAYLQERSKRAGAGGATANHDSGGRGYFGLDLGLDGRVMTLEDVENVFCPTGEGGGVDPTCSPPSGGGLPASKMPAEPSFVSSNVTAVKANKAAIQSMKDLASSGALETLKAHEGTPSPKVQQFKKDLIAALEQHKADEEDRIPWASLVDSEDDYAEGAIIVEDDPAELPTSLAGAKILKENMGGGSQTPPKLIEKDGKKLVMKVSKNAATLDHIKSEVDADNAYRAAGFAVPVSSMSTYGGKDVKIAEFLEGAKELNEWENNASYEEIAAVYADIAKGMAADALFANWDAVGTGKNNIMVKENPFGPPNIFRVDNGGSFKYRAMGELKKDWNYKVTLKSLQDPSKNPNADVYANVTDEELHGQIQSLLDKKLDIIKAVKDPDTRDILEQRFNHMESQMAALAPAPPAPKPSSLLPDGDSITDLLKGKGDKAHTKLYMKKVAALNPNGIENGTVKIPISFYTPAKGSKEAAIAKLHETVKWLEGKVPAGTKVEAVEKYLTAKTLGITKTFGNDGDKFTSTQATTAAQEHATIPNKFQKYLPSPVKGVVTLTNTPDPPKDETWKAKLSLTEKNAVSSWKGSAKDIRVAISSGRMTSTAKAFMSVLEKAPIHEGVVYRGISGKYAADIAKHMEAAGIGGLWSDAAPHCMSTNIATAKSFANGKVLLRIVTKTGRTIWKEDGYSSEKEVTGMPGTLYKIMAIDKDVKDTKVSGYAGKLNHMITLMEVGKK